MAYEMEQKLNAQENKVFNVMPIPKKIQRNFQKNSQSVCP